ncbi:DUF4335 domain-containing protein [Calothrix sp. PCC 6303]|uniref:DUF4335 domain-containing protein n=1 Tax=Calothrix sp. PCC 6303 TaxID=1170562 RepID=UPI0002A018E8|nr:DUF4335 domain-containing protein [Calothrix sp. PCC 6303]AFZ00379.1 hypothetical protein Cal6303_1319 [Calothrix sp. PCC 6303]
MPLSNPVIRRYTPPTCTLEVLAQSSPLSRWTGKSVLKDLRFELRLDDPRLPEEERIAIRGDRDQLEALHTAVSSYVQEFIHKSPENFREYYSPGNQNRDLGLDNQTLTDSSNNSYQTNTIIPFNQENSRSNIHLQPGRNLTHNLFLGSLASHTSAPVIQLSLLQLFDLATALDEYSADVMALPNLDSNSNRRSGIPKWAPMAAVAAVAVALIPITYQHANRTRLQEQTATTSSSVDEKIALEPSPQQESSVQLSPSPNSTFSSGLPTLPPGLVNPQAGNPNLIPGAGGLSPVMPNAANSTNQNLGTQQNKIPTQNPGNNTTGNSGNLFSSSGDPIFGTNPANSGKLSSGNAIAFSNNPAAGNNLAGNSSGVTKTNTNRVSPTKGTGSSPNSPTTGLGGNISPPYGASSELPQLSPIPPIVPSAPINQRISGNAKNPPTPTGDEKSQLVSRLREGRKPDGAVATANRSGSNGTLFDTPQIAEARDFLKKRWRPPAGLKQTLEYSLIVGVDGTLERIYPLGKAATDNIERTGMPRISERFVSPNRNGQSVRIRAVFSPDGQVQALPEGE